jgi:hypothetical protein
MHAGYMEDIASACRASVGKPKKKISSKTHNVKVNFKDFNKQQETILTGLSWIRTGVS